MEEVREYLESKKNELKEEFKRYVDNEWNIHKLTIQLEFINGLIKDTYKYEEEQTINYDPEDNDYADE